MTPRGGLLCHPSWTGRERCHVLAAARCHQLRRWYLELFGRLLDGVLFVRPHLVTGIPACLPLRKDWPRRHSQSGDESYRRLLDPRRTNLPLAIMEWIAWEPSFSEGLRSRRCPHLAVCHECRLSWAVRNCTRDEGGPFEFGNQVLISSHRKLLWSKATVVNVAETSGHDLGRHG